MALYDSAACGVTNPKTCANCDDSDNEQRNRMIRDALGNTNRKIRQYVETEAPWNKRYALYHGYSQQSTGCVARCDTHKT